jgi:hypothetical protein
MAVDHASGMGAVGRWYVGTSEQPASAAIVQAIASRFLIRSTGSNGRVRTGAANLTRFRAVAAVDSDSNPGLFGYRARTVRSSAAKIAKERFRASPRHLTNSSEIAQTNPSKQQISVAR